MATFKYPEGMGLYRDRLVNGPVRRGYDPELAERVSSWLKAHHSTVFATALLNSQPMGFYAPGQIVGNAASTVCWCAPST